MGESLGHVCGGQHEEESDQTTGHVHAVETGGQVEGGAITVAREGQALVHELHVFGDLAADEEGAHEEGDDEPLAQCLDIAPLRGEYTELARDGGEDQNGGVDAGEGNIQQLGFFGPHLGVDRSEGEVHGEEGGEEHELAGQPDDGADRHHVGPIRRRMGIGSWDSRRIRHARILPDQAPLCVPTPHPIVPRVPSGCPVGNCGIRTGLDFGS